MINVAVIIANWNGKKFLKDCLDSLRNQTYKNFQVIFVDNGSEDDSVDFVRENYPEVILKEIDRNIGFAGGYNLGFRLALKDKSVQWVVALNNDTKLDEKYLEEMIECAKRHPNAGSIQPKVLNFFEKDSIDCLGIILSADGVAMNRGYGEIDRGQYEQETEIFGANGTASLFSREILEKTQIKHGEYFDRRYFAYYEDVDLAWRMRLAGFESYYCPKAIVQHIHSATAGKISGFKAYYLNRNRFFTLTKNYPLCQLMIIFLVLTPVRYIFLFFRIIMKKGRKGAEFSGQKKSMVAKEILRAWGSFIVNIPDLIKNRRIIQRQKKVKCSEIRRWFRDYKVNFSKTF